jgi:hypothetical protein
VAERNKKRQKGFSSSFSIGFVLRICEIVHILLKGRKPLKDCLLKLLSPHKHSLRKINVEENVVP